MYRIVNWHDNFENNRSRELKKLDWVPIPNKLEGDGYTELLDHDNGAAHYGAWCALVLIASKCDPRGTLVRDGARPHDFRSLARMTRVPVAVWEEAIPRLVHIGWLEIIDAQDVEIQAVTATETQVAPIPQAGATIPQDDAEERLRKGRELKGKGIELKGKEQQEIANYGDAREGGKGKGTWQRLTSDEADRAVDRAIEFKRHIKVKDKYEALTLLRIAALEIRTVPEDYIANALDRAKQKKRCRDPSYFLGSLKGIANDRGDSVDGLIETIVFDETYTAAVLKA